MKSIKVKDLFSIDWLKAIQRLAFIFTAAIIVISTWYVIKKADGHYNAKTDAASGKVLIDVSISDTLTRGMDDKLNIVLQDLLRMKQDSLAVEVRKVQNTK